MDDEKRPENADKAQDVSAQEFKDDDTSVAEEHVPKKSEPARFSSGTGYDPGNIFPRSNAQETWIWIKRILGVEPFVSWIERLLK